MGKYTGLLEEKSFNIFDKDDYIEEMEKVVGIFRTFDKALDTFIVEHGFHGNLENIEEKVKFISDTLKESAGIPLPRNIKKWYTEHKTIERKTAFQICFAFQLKVEEVDDFLRRICLSRGFDCHSMEEVVYYYAFKNGLNYQDAVNILSEITKVKPGKMEKKTVVYTDYIVEEIDRIDSIEELKCFLTENADIFEYNNASAYHAIHTIWMKISENNGLAIREKKKLYSAFDKDKEEPGEEEFDIKELEKKEPEEKEFGKEKLEKEAFGKEELEKDRVKVRKERKRVDDSVWEIYLQILGLSGNYVSKFYKNRSLKAIFRDNQLLHPIAEASFPDRDGLNKILNDEHVSYERVRKMLILLIFYKFWVGKALQNNHYEAGYHDADGCITYINDILIDVGYPMLYAGNPYDFIILTAINSDYPLITFREYMREMFFLKEEEVHSQYEG